MQVTINDVRYAVHDALAAAFPTVTVSSVAPNPPLESPYFLVRLLEFTQTQELGNRYRRSLPFVVQYVAAQQSIDDKYAIAEVMMAVLKYVTVGGYQLPGQSLSIAMIDGELHLFVTYAMLVQEQLPDSPKMQQLEEGTTVG